jgi:CBS domain-containing protein
VYGFADWQVQDVMSEPITIDAGAKLAEAEALLEKHGFNSLPVVDPAGKLVGLVSSLDLLEAFRFPDDDILPSYESVLDQPVSKFAKRDVGTVCPRTPLSRVIEKMVDTRRKSFPVLDDDRLVGMVAREDVLGALRRSAEGSNPPQGGS